MALKATVFKVELQIADMARNYYHDHALTLARHPSETDERLMMRLLAFALNASVRLAFGRGLSTDDEPDLWQKDLTGAIELWIDTGLPDLGAPVPADANHVHFGDGSTSTEITLEPGQHTLRMLLADHRHIPHDPPVASNPITITVE